MENKYHYIIFGYPRDYFRIMFQDAIERLGAEYIEDPIKYSSSNRLKILLYKIHYNPYLNWRWNLPFKKVWFSSFYNKIHSKPLCFIFLMDWCSPSYKGLIDVLRKKYADARFVLYLEDLVERHNISLEEVQKFDLSISYDKGDAAKYGFEYMPTFLSKVDLSTEGISYDCNFIGLPKNRLPIIYQLFESLTNAGLKCDFIVSSLKDKNSRIDGIQYIRKDMSYWDYLHHVANAKCLVEVLQKNCSGYTLRTWEALLYGKKLLTNNPEILKAPFYNEQQFIYFEDPYKIDIDRIKRNIDVPFFDTEKISPLNLFNLIEKMI